MKPQISTDTRRWKIKKIAVCVCVYQRFIFTLFIGSAILFTACNELEKPKPEPFYSQTAPPPKQEFRWSNGKMPKSFDPALAAAPPETNIVRAIFECLTEIEPKTLKPVAAAAIDWKSSNDYKTWTFNLRRNAKWSNGENVTAKDFVRAWKRLLKMKEKVIHYELLDNIFELNIKKVEIPSAGSADKFNNSSNKISELGSPTFKNQSNTNTSDTRAEIASEDGKEANLSVEEPEQNRQSQHEPAPGVKAIDNYTLKISLVNPDKDFPALVAHPLFSPVFGDGKNLDTEKLNADIVTNGAFRIFSVGQDGITLDRAENYWNAREVELERVRFVPTENAEKALEAYRAGDIDAVTNAEFEPLALKLLTPFDDFRRTTHSALNFYEFNWANAPFNDQRVREALAISIERELLTEGEMEDTAEPALSFLPHQKEQTAGLLEDSTRAKELLTQAGFPGGENFPNVRLLVNRNNTQQKIARSVAKMWKRHLNINTEIIVKESAELNFARESNDFDVIRRGEVLPTLDEIVSMRRIFPSKKVKENKSDKNPPAKETDLNSEAKKEEKYNLDSPKVAASNDDLSLLIQNEENAKILTADEAIFEFAAIPLYFPISYSLVKPYITGFETNSLDAPSLKDVEIDNNWQPKKAVDESK
ncbi:MAG: peptide ABC transporter substrate-binding protein [Pyrinomonadaceae bacterium]